MRRMRCLGGVAVHATKGETADGPVLLLLLLLLVLLEELDREDLLCVRR